MTKWQIVPKGDGFRYVNVDANGCHCLNYKASGDPNDRKLLFSSKERADEYISAHLSDVYVAEEVWGFTERRDD